eukprot:TRINITY_DN67484_c3_g5_i1.p1 TRINITY_DN67484_c3_g5~~TRINITY_DN67484_c3_g5_i1.p1  ORF type:complete len:576 (-),score=52.48 TRINITY_DN67484_c3_g5_i1:129-1856(-)
MYRTGPSGPGGAISKSEHPISLKVMRLRKPELYTHAFGSPYADTTDLLPIETVAAEQCQNSCSALTLPKDFGQIYVGETFRSYISLHNHHLGPVKNVILKAELLSQSGHRYILLDITPQPLQQFHPNTNKDFIVEYPLTEVGGHTLICTVTYFDDYSQENKTFRKIFKFQVSHPLAIKSVKIYTLKTTHLQEHIFVVLDLQNKTAIPLFVESVRLDPCQTFGLIDHSVDDESALEPTNPDEIRRYLFELVPKTLESTVGGHRNALGQVEIKWRTNLGECGNLVTNMIEHRAGEKADLEILVTDAPDVILIEESFTVNIIIQNVSDNEVDLAIFLHVEKMYPLCFNGPSYFKVGKIKPKGSLTVPLTLFALSTGLQNLAGIELRDLRTEKTYPHDLKTPLCSVLVKHESESSTLTSPLRPPTPPDPTPPTPRQTVSPQVAAQSTPVPVAAPSLTIDAEEVQPAAPGEFTEDPLTPSFGEPLKDVGEPAEESAPVIGEPEPEPKPTEGEAETSAPPEVLAQVNQTELMDTSTTETELSTSDTLEPTGQEPVAGEQGDDVGEKQGEEEGEAAPSPEEQ